MVQPWGCDDTVEEKGKYFSAEFELDNPRVFFQFKLRHTDANAIYMVVQKDSRALECLKEGHKVPMIFYSHDNGILAEKKNVRITSVQDGKSIGFVDHFLVALSV